MKSKIALAALTLATTSLGLTTRVTAAETAEMLLEEIVVTAQRREVSLLKTPVAVTAFSGDQLTERGISSTSALSGSIPNVDLHPTDSGVQVTIRGITSNDQSEKGDPSAAIMMDGIYIARPQAQEVSFFDINRVEVLRGPQGTLWGRNTTAGLVHIISNKPVHSLESAINVSVGDFKTSHLDAMTNVPVSDTLALRLAIASDRRDSYITQIDPPGFSSTYSDDPLKKNLSARVQALWEPNDSVSLLVRGDYSTLKGAEGVSQTLLASNAFNLPTLTATAPALPIQASFKSPRPDSKELRVRNHALSDGHQDDKSWGISPELNWKFDNFQLTYLGSYRKLSRDDGSPYVSGAPFTIPGFVFADYWQNSQEFRIATSADGPFEGQAGVYYFKEKASIALWLPNLIPGVPYFGFPQDPSISESKAVFGQGSFHVTPEVKLTAGVRYTKDEKSRLGATAFQQTLTFNPATDGRLLNWAELSSSKTTWRVGAEYNPTQDSMYYASVATGYKAGGFGDGCEAGVRAPNGVLCNQVNSTLYYQPENLTAYEVGYKGKFADKLTFSAVVFKYDYKDMQLSATGEVGGAPSLVTQNAGEATVKGLEIESTYAPSAAHRFDLSLSFLDAEYQKYLGGPVSTTNFAGYDLDHSPNSSGTIGYTYRYPLAAGDALSLDLRSKYSASYVLTDYSNGVQFTQPSYTKSDASVSYNAAGSKWYASVFVHNLEDHVQVTQIGFFGTWNMYTSEPRIYGISTGVKF